MMSAPFLAVYGTVLLLLAFLSSLRLRRDELYPDLAHAVLVDFDMATYPAPCIHLGAKVFYAFSFLLLFRQQLKEKQEEQDLKESEESLDEVKVLPRLDSSPFMHTLWIQTDKVTFSNTVTHALEMKMILYPGVCNILHLTVL